MKTNLKSLVIVFGGLLCSILRLHSQGYIVPNGVVMNFNGLFSPTEIDVLHDPSNPTSGGSYTGFQLNPINADTFQFAAVLDIGVRVFFVSPSDPISLQPILSQSYIELGYAPSYVFADGVPFYVGLYTGNVQTAPPDGIYDDPLFGWAELENVGGAIQLLDSALEYKGGGIYAGTQNIIQIPEPGILALVALGGLFFGLRRRRKP
jgi:hypothetical protein